MVRVTLPCATSDTETQDLTKNKCQNDTASAVTSLTTKCTDNLSGTAGTEVISDPLVNRPSIAANNVTYTKILLTLADDVWRTICHVG